MTAPLLYKTILYSVLRIMAIQCCLHHEQHRHARVMRSIIFSIYMSTYHFNKGSLVLFAMPPKRFFGLFLLRGTQRTRRYITRYVWVSCDVSGACTGRLIRWDWLYFQGLRVRTKKTVTTTCKLEKEHFLAGCLPR